MEHYLTVINNTIKKFLQAMGFEAEIEIDASDSQNIIVNVQTEEAGYLIGQAGANLQALQHLVRLLVNKKINTSSKEIAEGQKTGIQFIVDVNNYKKHRVNLLRELAQSMAVQAISENAPLFLQPMPAYERRIIHVALIDHPQIETESTGEGENRRVIIRPKFTR